MSATEESLLTAYALNELEGAELAQVERLVQRDPAARAEVEAIRVFAGVLGAALTAEPIPQAPAKAKSGHFSAVVRWSFPIAAALVLGFGVSHFALRPSTSVHREPDRIADGTEPQRFEGSPLPTIGVPEFNWSNPGTESVPQTLQVAFSYRSPGAPQSEDNGYYHIVPPPLRF